MICGLLVSLFKSGQKIEFHITLVYWVGVLVTVDILTILVWLPRSDTIEILYLIRFPI